MPRHNAHEQGPLAVDRIVGARIRALRRSRKKSQSDMGTYCGITFQQIQKYENGVNRVGASRLAQISEYLGVTPNYFFEGAGQGKPASKKLADALGDKASQELLLAFHAIKNDVVRRALMTFVASLSAA
jgi:transcriptional regulator with XRE-family HTH domain